ncbi:MULTISPECIES: flagellar hook-length control protein FliK [unclassified Undibacterium]|uniref:flagellar hook-length control protein FliK n=1 Tax=unclassified Undibacterium TaxID=2630295 RepID=UPI002AC8B199|nr:MULTISPECIES: flagellar hook-length control protein FliK [unclassified Undibacterium]MEB0139851.1 flagellar hook-length control protein FliK [Undibacterium sp. CCC2.1]MEB0172781.1 flagellar hook-length control protein FliK [Undibacterium sp. CCC1.1]MEB0176573.1 flagellar hook-length control protein FliK [Undibacterium sp. CCC3.4]MEB0215837.1 flagellar hook-length control protein FliK [Undibacterium sp. 5I2]WPX42688.1 flagellar hook-length control protein FliK [Undibacterium sp. CCC3.4]
MIEGLDSAARTPLASVAGASKSVVLLGPAEALSHLSSTTELKAQVLSQLADGSFEVDLAGSRLHMLLPAGSQVGDNLAMRLTNSTPPGLSLSTPGMLTAETKSAATNSTAATALAASLAASSTSALPTSASSRTTLSDASRLINLLLQLPSAAPPAASEPVLTHADLLADSSSTAAALQQQITQSGVFYESHLAQWATGQKPLHEVLQEPQAHLPSLAATAWSDSAATDSADHSIRSLVQQQLQTLDDQTLRWRGDIFPGQALEWDIRRERGTAKAPKAGPAEEQWQSVLRLDMPNLGPVQALLTLRGQTLQLRLQAPDAAVATALSAATPTLSAALAQAAGMPAMITVQS